MGYAGSSHFRGEARYAFCRLADPQLFLPARVFSFTVCFLIMSIQEESALPPFSPHYEAEAEADQFLIVLTVDSIICLPQCASSPSHR